MKRPSRADRQNCESTSGGASWFAYLLMAALLAIAGYALITPAY